MNEALLYLAQPQAEIFSFLLPQLILRKAALLIARGDEAIFQLVERAGEVNFVWERKREEGAGTGTG
jgi:hypothetical protein